MRCTVCRSTDVRELVRLDRAPLLGNWPRETREEAVQVPLGRIDLQACRRCGHIFNAAFDPDRLVYAPGYENALEHSPRFRSYVEELVADLLERHELRAESVVEIGCGRGYFLDRLCERAGARGWGFDPSTPPDVCAAHADGPVRIERIPFDRRHASIRPALVCCRHVLEHLADPRQLLDEVRWTLEGRADAALLFEVPNGLRTLDSDGVWDLIYEHCSYFSPSSLRWLFEESGFRVEEVLETYGGQFLVVHARLDAGPGRAPRASLPDALPERVAESFAESLQVRVHGWRSWLEALRRDGGTAAVWGAGSKGVTFLNLVRPGATVSQAVDVNPHKHGKFVAGTGHEIRAPHAMSQPHPDVLIVMNPLYVEEVRRAAGEVGLDADIVTV